MRIHVLQHVPFEGPAHLGDWAAARGHRLSLSHLYAGDPPPHLDAFDWLVIMGGPMGVGDEAEHSWLAAEKERIRDAIDAGKTVVGVCLGAQLIAEVLGARVYRNGQKEIGWFPIELTAAALEADLCRGLPTPVEVYHWHGDTFDPPPGAVHLARSAACAQQAFVYAGRVLGLQFHIEATPESVAAICTQAADEIVPGPYVQTADQMQAVDATAYAAIHRMLETLLDRLPA